MTREISGLAKYAYDRLRDNLPSIFSYSRRREDGDYDVVLTDYVIMKVYDDLITFDIVGEKDSILADDFISIMIS